MKQKQKQTKLKILPPPAPPQEASAAAIDTAPVEETVSEAGTEDDESLKPEDIRTVAYLKFLDSGGLDGNDLEHWFQAEAQLKKKKK